MLTGKTKNGVPLRSTVGMGKKAATELWFLAADRSQVRLLQQIRRATGPEVVAYATFSHTDGRKRAHEGMGHSHTSEEKVLEQLVQEAKTMVENAAFDTISTRLHVFAEPKLLGRLRPALQRTLYSAALRFHEGDFSWVPTHALTVRLTEFVAQTSRDH